MRKISKIGMVVAVAIATTFTLASPAVAVTRYFYGPNGCYGYISDVYTPLGQDGGDTYYATCPTSAPGTEWRADVTWHTPSYQYSVAGLQWRAQGSWNGGGVLRPVNGFMDAIGNWQLR
jgi:hypothetical protein